MKLIIAGSRKGELDASDRDRLNQIEGVTEVVSGAQKGIDAHGERWAASKGLPIKRFPADWGTYGLAAGPIRNAEMAEYADAVALFPGGKGTASMLKEAQRAGIKIFDFRSKK